ncbi:MAG: hypothetical protein ACRECH_11890 [Nitrososphaerales archaeon]
MGFVVEALWQIKLGEFKSAASLLETHLKDEGLKPVSRLSLMEWAADCYCKCQEHGQAAKWFEVAGRTVLECPGLAPFERRSKAAAFFERALECHRVANDIQGIKRISALRYSLTLSC